MVMHIWTLKNWKEYYDLNDVTHRSGLYLRFDKEVEPEVKRACKEFGKWLRKNYFFPIKIPIYFKETEFIKALDGDLVSATFFEPYDKTVEPYIRIATGDYIKLLNKSGKNNALGSVLYSMAHGLTHYFQWINDIHLTSIGQERQATVYAGYIIDEYKKTRKHP